MSEQGAGEMNGSTIIQNTCFEENEEYHDASEHLEGFKQTEGD